MIDYATFRRHRRHPEPIEQIARTAVLRLARAGQPIGAYIIDRTKKGGAILTLIEESGLRRIAVPRACLLQLTQAHAHRTAARELAKAAKVTKYTCHYQPVYARSHYDDSCGGWRDHA